MKMMYSDNGEDVCIVMSQKEARALCDACTEITEPSGKKLSKRSKEWKVAHEISQEFSVW